MPTGDPLAPAGETTLVSKMVAAESALPGEPAPSSPEYRDYHRRRLQEEAQSKEKVRSATTSPNKYDTPDHNTGSGGEYAPFEEPAPTSNNIPAPTSTAEADINNLAKVLFQVMTASMQEQIQASVDASLQALQITALKAITD